MSGPVLEILGDPDLMEFRVWQETGTVTIYYSVYRRKGLRARSATY